VTDLRDRAWRLIAEICDPELPALTIEDLGILRDVRVVGHTVEVDITPSYTACPAIGIIALEIRLALEKAGIMGAQVRTILSPAWTSDWLSEIGKEKLRAYGIAPPTGRGSGLFKPDQVACPRCSATDTRRISNFGSTACKALFSCNVCREPFEGFKGI
jgi:ring-1,2-phenylacetyl-CoA epoxidase subunit PaaD